MNTNDQNKPTSTGKEMQMQQWREELQQSPVFQNMAAGYDPDSVTRFVEHYVHQKFIWVDRAEQLGKRYEDQQLVWVNLAHEHLKIILQKKLFDAQCLWRAEQVQFDGVQIGYDFVVWEADILNCPFIEPVTDSDIEMYTQYLRHPDAQMNMRYAQGGLLEWQDYAVVKSMLEAGHEEVMPAWYLYHNNYTTAGSLLLLPDTRGDKESYYRKRYHADAKKTVAATKKQEELKPFLFYLDRDFFKQVVQTVESRQVQQAYKLFNWATQFRDEEDNIQMMTWELLRAAEAIPVQPHANWYEALVQTHKQYKATMIAEAFPQALEQYRMQLQMGIAFARDEKQIEDKRNIRAIWEEAILKGRAIDGEPGDFNF